MEMIKLIGALFFSCFVIDMVWLGLIAKQLYADAIGSLLLKTPNWLAAVVVYLAITLGIVLFVLPKASGNYQAALIWGGGLGAIIYLVYDFTNLAVLANWSLKISIIDSLWGTFLFAIVSVIGVFLQKKFS